MKDWKYIAYIAILVGLLVLLLLSKSKQYDWTVTFSPEDKNPYGGYALNELLPTALGGQRVVHSFKTLYESKDSLRGRSLFILCKSFVPDRPDTEVLLKHVHDGATVFISADFFYGAFADTLGIYTGDSFFQGEARLFGKDTTRLRVVAAGTDSIQTYAIKRGNAFRYFQRVDSVPAWVLAKNDLYQPVSIRVAWGKGKLILNCTPMLFTNLHLLEGENHRFAAHLLSYLPAREAWWSEYYHLGRMEIATPLRFILQTEPLRWAYYLTIGALLLFIVFEAKRKQRVIPILRPLANTTLEFIGTIGLLYYQRADHKNMAEKKAQFFFDYVRTHWGISVSPTHPDFKTALMRKSGMDEATVQALLSTLQSYAAKAQLSGEELTYLCTLIDRFYLTKK
jgi:hypothetical protein